MNNTNKFNQSLYDWKQSQNPIKVTFVKKECETILVEDNKGNKHRVNKNRIWASSPVMEPGDIIEVRKDDLKGDYLSKL